MFLPLICYVCNVLSYIEKKEALVWKIDQQHIRISEMKVESTKKFKIFKKNDLAMLYNQAIKSVLGL